MRLRNTLAASCCIVALIGLAEARAQAPASREVPEGFVLPGPPPTNAPAAAGTAPGAALPGSAPAVPGSATPAAPKPASPPTVSGSLVTAPTAVLPTAGTTQLLGAGSAGPKHRWPCVQRKVDHVDAGQVWSGPSLEAAANLPRTDAMRQLVASIAARRLPLPDAEKAAVDFVKALPEDQRASAASAVFADLLRSLNDERSQIMNGIERYGAKQQALAARLRDQNTQLSDIRSRGETAKANDAQEALLWDTRLFDERRRSLTYVCEVPTLIEQRLFALGRAMSGAL